MKNLCLSHLRRQGLYVAIALCAVASSSQAQTEFATWSAAANVKHLPGDFNGDGATDIALIGGDPAWWSTMPVAFSNRDGSFNVTNVDVGQFADWAAAANVKALVGDYDGDGKSDVALIGGDPNWWIFMPVAFSRGNGAFRTTAYRVGEFAAWAAAPNVEALVGDFDGDGKSDVALAGGDPAWWHTMPVAFSTGKGSFKIKNTDVGVFAVRAGVPSTKKVVGDFDGDGKADVAVIGSAASGTLPVAFSMTKGRFDVRDVAIGDFATWGSLPGVKAMVGDFDGDARSDIALIGGPGWNTIPVAFSNGDGSFRVTNTSAVFASGNLSALASHGAARVVAGDANGDGRTDITVISASVETYTALSSGNGSFSMVGSVPGKFAMQSHEAGVVALPGDFNRDGRLDIALTGAPYWHTVPVAYSSGGAWTASSRSVQPPVVREYLPVRGWVTASTWEPYANRCVVDPVGSLRSLQADPAYVMGYRSGADSDSVWAPTTGNGLTHRQGIQRINRAGRNFLAVSSSTGAGWPAGLELISLNSRGDTLGAMGGNVQPFQLSPAGDSIRAYLGDSSTRNHASGFQINGEFAVLPLEAENDSVTAGFRIARLSDPSNPSWAGLVPRTNSHVTDAGAAGLVRLQSGRFMALVFGHDSSNVDTFISSLPEMPGFSDYGSEWEAVSSATTPFGSSAYQSIQILTGCDGQFYIVGTHRHWTSENDWADLWRMDVTDLYEPVFTKLANFNAKCRTTNTGGTRYCDFAAGAGVYVDGQGQLQLYGVEHYNDGYPGTARMVKVREFAATTGLGRKRHGVKR